MKRLAHRWEVNTFGHRQRLCTGFLLVVLCQGFLSVCVLAQATEGTILGTVVDSSGGAVVGAAVTITSLQTGWERKTATSEIGDYVVTNLPLGSYAVSVEAPGFKKAVHPPVEITVKSRVRVNLALELGEGAQTIDVTTSAPLIKTDSPEVGGVISRQYLQEVPIFGRNFLSIAALVPGTSPGATADRRRALSGEAVTISGASSEANNFIIDGISNNMEFSGAMGVVPAIDAIQEFAIQTSQYSAEFGRAGGGVINVAIKSGTSEYHGFAYDYLRNDKLDARPYDFTGTNPRKQPLRRNQFGGGIGGPIKKDRIFIFGNYEGIRFPSSLLNAYIVPTAAEKRGDFSNSGFGVYDPLTTRTDPSNPSRRIRDPFPGNLIPQARFDPIIVKLLDSFPDPNFTDPNPNSRNNYLVAEPGRDDLNSYNVKSDLHLTTSNTMTVRYSEQRGGRERSGWMPNNLIGAESSLDATNTGITYTHVFGPNLVNEARFGYNYLRFGNDLVNHDNALSEFNIPGIGDNPAADGYPAVRMQNLSQTDTARPIPSLPTPFVLVEHSFQWMDNISWQRKNHTLKFGGEFVRQRNDRFQGLVGNADLRFDGRYTTQVVGQTLEASRTGLPDALLGLSNNFITQYVFDGIRLRSSRFGAFAQDDWRLSNKLTLSLGMRYDVYTPYGELRDRVVNFDFTTGQRVLPQNTRSLVESMLGIPGGNLPSTFRYASRDEVVPKTNFSNFSPRFGFAYALNTRFVVRGGYGIFYGVTVSNNASNAGTNAPFFTTVSQIGELETPIIIQNGFPTGGALAVFSSPTLGIYYQPLDRNDPYTQKYSLNLQFNPLKGTALEVGFTGQRALAFPTLAQLNYPEPGPGAIQPRRPFPNLGRGTSYQDTNDSNYNALEITLRQQEFHGFTLQSAFTFSKSLGYLTGTDGGVQTDPYNNRYDYGPLSYDFRKRWVTSWIYRIPFPNDTLAVARHILGNWQTSGLVTLQGGFPFSALIAGHVLNNDLGGNRADVLRDPNLPTGDRTRERWFDTEAFGVPPIYVWGNQGKNILRAPGLAQVDFALQKAVPISEKKKVTFRVEAANVFNRVNLGQPFSTFRGANFGVIRTLAGGPRNIQMALRFDF